MSLQPTENKPDLEWECPYKSGYLLWRGGLLFKLDKKPTEEECAVYASACLEVESQGMNPKMLPGRRLFAELIGAPLLAIMQRDASSQSTPLSRTA